ncbi:MAG: SCO family protein [Planctomycetota bacterium]
MRSVVIHVVLALAGAALVSAAFFMWSNPAPKNDSDQALDERATLDDAWDGFRLANFELTDHNGAVVAAESFEGQVTALAFFFTRCPGVCPQLIGMMSGAERTATTETGTEDLRFAAISVDGNHDSPEVLSSYAARLRLDLQRWALLTGDPIEVARIVEESISFEIRPDTTGALTGPGGEPVMNILHPTRVLLIGKDRRLLGTFSYTDPDDLERLITAASKALAG